MPLTIQEATDKLNEVAKSQTEWQGILHGNQKFYTVPKKFDTSELPDDSIDKDNHFELWSIENNGDQVIRHWKKW